MVLNYIWIAFFLLAALCAIIQCFIGNTGVFADIVGSTFENAKTAFEISIGLTGVLSLWMGIMKIGEKGGVVNVLSRMLSPLFTRLFPGIPKGHPATGHIFMNIAANMLGLDNAATPLGLKAMESMQELNVEKNRQLRESHGWTAEQETERNETATNPMIMFLVLNTSGLTIIPVSIMAYRAKAGAADPTDVFIPLLLTTMVSTLVGLTVCSLYQRINLFNRYILLLFLVIAGFVAGLFTLIFGMDNEHVQQFCRLLTSGMILGAIIIFICSGWRKKLNVYNSFIEGAKGGFEVAVKLIPYCVAILVAVGVFRASGGLEMLQHAVERAVALLKPLSGPGARGMMLDCFAHFGPDSFVGHLASVMQGCTDTTFYILAVYFGSVGIKKYRYSVACGLTADIAGMVAAVFFSYFFFG